MIDQRCISPYGRPASIQRSWRAPALNAVIANMGGGLVRRIEVPGEHWH